MASLHVAPVLAANDKPDKAWADAEALRDVVLGISFCDAKPDLSHVGIGEFGPTVPLSEGVPAFSDHIGSVIGIGAKEQMVWVDTGRGVAAVTHAHPRRYFTDEKDVGYAVCALRLPVWTLAGSENAISILKPTASPKETAVDGGCPRKEPEHGIGAVMIASSHVSLPSGSLVRPGCDVYGIVPGRIYSISGG